MVAIAWAQDILSLPYAAAPESDGTYNPARSCVRHDGFSLAPSSIHP